MDLIKTLTPPPPPEPFARGYAHSIGRIRKRHHHGGDVCDCCVCGVEYFPYYSYCRILRGSTGFLHRNRT